MSIVGGADRYPVEGVVGTLLFGAETVELFLFDKEGAVGEEAVQATYAVELVIGSQKVWVSAIA